MRSCDFLALFCCSWCCTLGSGTDGSRMGRDGCSPSPFPHCGFPFWLLRADAAPLYPQEQMLAAPLPLPELPHGKYLWFGEGLVGPACCKQGQTITFILGVFGPAWTHPHPPWQARTCHQLQARLCPHGAFLCWMGCCQEPPAALLGGSIVHPQVPLGCCPILGDSGGACPDF